MAQGCRPRSGQPEQAWSRGPPAVPACLRAVGSADAGQVTGPGWATRSSFPLPGQEGQCEGPSHPRPPSLRVLPGCRRGAGLGLTGPRHRLEPKEVNRATRRSGLGTGEGVPQDPRPVSGGQVGLAGRGRGGGGDARSGVSGRVTGGPAVLHTNYISNQRERGTGINLPCGQLCGSSWNRWKVPEGGDPSSAVRGGA